MADDDFVMEEREAAMVSPAGGDVVFRKAHFLKPSISDGSVAALSPNCSAGPPPLKWKELPLKVNYQGWIQAPENWKSWVDHLHKTHKSTWKKAGILDPIITSKCNIHRYEGLIMELVEKWCPKTNSFVFPWGEATITLEDVMVIGGYSVVGESVLIDSEDEEMDETIKKLVSARVDIVRSSWRNADRSKWMAKFIRSGSQIEHEAFLAYWLSRFIFPFTWKTISKNVLSIAAHLARGTRVALGPSILATIYKSLTFLKAAVITAGKSVAREEGNGVLHVTVPGPLALVQVWIWERFPSLRPRPEPGGDGPRLARWDNLKLGSECRSLTIDSARKDFQWRPYSVDWETNDSDLEGFARCVRTGELVSLEETCIEHYLPHRVALQFGMDQDIPGDVARVNADPEVAWRHYTRLIRDAKLYIPPRVSDPCVTTRYLAWWKSISHKESEVEEDLFGRKWVSDFFTPPPGFSLKWKKVKKAGAFSDQKVVKRKRSPLSSSSSRKLKIKLAGNFEYNNSAPPIGRKGSSRSLKRQRKDVVWSSSDESDHPPGFAARHSQEDKASRSSTSTRVEEERTQDTSSESRGNNQSRDNANEKTNHSNDQGSGQVEEARMDEKSGMSPSQVSGRLDIKFGSFEKRITIIEKLGAFIKAGKLVGPL